MQVPFCFTHGTGNNTVKYNCQFEKLDSFSWWVLYNNYYFFNMEVGLFHESVFDTLFHYSSIFTVQTLQQLVVGSVNYHGNSIQFQCFLLSTMPLSLPLHLACSSNPHTGTPRCHKLRNKRNNSNLQFCHFNFFPVPVALITFDHLNHICQYWQS